MCTMAPPPPATHTKWLNVRKNSFKKYQQKCKEIILTEMQNDATTTENSLIVSQRAKLFIVIVQSKSSTSIYVSRKTEVYIHRYIHKCAHEFYINII